MKKVVVIGILVFLLLPLIVGLVSAGRQDWSNVGPVGNVFRYIFGPQVDETVTADNTSAAIITIAVWILIIITFGDVLTTFSTFSKPVSWITAIIIGVITANLKFSVILITYLTGAFAALGVTAVYAGLGAAFVAFIAVNLGIKTLGKWVLRRKAYMAAAKSEAGGQHLRGTIEGLKEIGRALERDL